MTTHIIYIAIIVAVFLIGGWINRTNGDVRFRAGVRKGFCEPYDLEVQKIVKEENLLAHMGVDTDRCLQCPDRSNDIAAMAPHYDHL